MRIASRHYFLILLTLIVAFALQLYRIDAQSIWFDEGWSAYAAGQPSLWQAAQADTTNPPLYYVLLNGFAAAAGDSAFALRLFSAFWGFLVIALGARLAKVLFNNQRAATFTAVMIALSPLLWWASQEARMYTLLAFEVTLIAFAWHTLLQAPRREVWLTLWVAELAVLYTHNTGPVVVLWINLATGIVWLMRRSAQSPHWRGWVGGQVLVGVLWLPYFVTRYLLLTSANAALVTPPQLALDTLSRIWQAFWSGSWQLVGQEPFMVGGTVVALLLTVLLLPLNRANGRWLVLHIVVLIAGLLAGLIVLGNDLHGRYLVMLTPLLLAAIGAGIARVPLRVLRYGALGVFAVIFVMAMRFSQNPLYGHDDARGMVRHYAETLDADDTVVAWSYADRYDLWYYWNRLGVQAERVTLPEGADVNTILPLLPNAGDIALNVWYTQRADFRGMMSCLLGNGTVNPPDTFTTYGMSSLRYHNPRPLSPNFDTLDIIVTNSGNPMLQIDHRGILPTTTADRALCLPLTATLLTETEADLKAAVIIKNSLGWEVAQTDAIFATANQRTTSLLQVGERVAAYPLLRLPYGAPAETYTVYLRVYDEILQPNGYSGDFLLGEWQVQPSADWTQVDSPFDEAEGTLITPDLSLLEVNAPDSLRNGEILPLRLLWRGTDNLPLLTLQAADGTWQVEAEAPEPTGNVIRLDWREVRVPIDATSGAAQLTLPDGTVIAAVNINATPYNDTLPDDIVEVDIALEEVGTLAGYAVAETNISLDEPPTVRLVWRGADSPPAESYTVFVQLLDEAGQVIAQSDHIPANGSRPTTTWRSDEVIVDEVTLTFNEQASPGSATLIAGMYDAATGVRLQTPNGADHMTLTTVRVENETG